MSLEQGESGGTVRIKLLDGRVVSMRLGPEEGQHYYRGAKIAPGAEREERAALADLVAGGPGPIGPYRDTDNNARIYRQGAHLYVGLQEAREAGSENPEDVEQRAVEADPAWLGDAGSDALQAAFRMEPVEDLLKRHHPGYDQRSRDERIELLMRGAEHLDKAWWALDALQEFMQVGKPSGRPKTKAADPQQDVRAAELRDALGLTYPEIGEALRVPRSDSDRRRYAHKPAEEMAGRGRGLLIKNLGKEGYDEYIEAIGPNLRRWYALGPRERLLQGLVENTPRLTGRTPEEAEGMRPSFERLIDERLSGDSEPPA